MFNNEAGWRRSSRCDSAACVEVRFVGGRVEVRDSKQPDGPVLAYSLDEWQYLVDVVKRDGWWLPAFLRVDDGRVDLVLPRVGGTAVLTVDRGDWDAFLAGVVDGEFDVERLSAPATP
jgi:hypothetical protein